MRTHRAALVSERALHCEAARIDCDDVKLRESTEYFPILLTRDYNRARIVIILHGGGYITKSRNVTWCQFNQS